MGKIISIAKMIFTLGIIYFLFAYLINVKQLWQILNGVDIPVLIIVIFFYIPSVYISTLKWHIIQERVYKLGFRFNHLLKLYFIGGFYNNLLPTTIGGDSYKFIRLSDEKKNKKKEILSSIVLERGFGFFALFAVNFASLLFISGELFKDMTFIIIEISMISVFLCILLLYIFRKEIIIRFGFLKKNHLFEKAFRLYDSLSVILSYPKHASISFLISVCFVLLSSFSYYLLFYSVGQSIGFFPVALVITLVSVFSIIPISFNNIGVSESLYIFLFAMFGITPEVSLLVGLLSRAILIIASMTGAFLNMYENYSKLTNRTS